MHKQRGRWKIHKDTKEKCKEYTTLRNMVNITSAMSLKDLNMNGLNAATTR